MSMIKKEWKCNTLGFRNKKGNDRHFGKDIQSVLKLRSTEWVRCKGRFKKSYCQLHEIWVWHNCLPIHSEQNSYNGHSREDWSAVTIVQICEPNLITSVRRKAVRPVFNIFSYRIQILEYSFSGNILLSKSRFLSIGTSLK